MTIVGAPDTVRSPDPESLLLEHRSLVEMFARRFARRHQEMDELRQVASIALWLAATRFDPDRGSPFEAYASRSIAGALKRYRRDTAWSWRVPRSLHDGLMRLSSVLEELTHELGRSPTVPELAERSGLSEETVIHSLEAGEVGHARSLEQARENGPEPGAGIIGDGAVAGQACDRVEVVEALSCLPEPLKSVVVMRFYQDKTQREIADVLGCSQVHVSRLLSRAMVQLRSRYA